MLLNTPEKKLGDDHDLQMSKLTLVGRTVWLLGCKDLNNTFVLT